MTSPSFFYSALLQANLKGHYMLNDGIPVYEKYGLEVMVFPAMDFERVCIVKRFYGKFTVKEL